MEIIVKLSDKVGMIFEKDTRTYRLVIKSTVGGGDVTSVEATPSEALFISKVISRLARELREEKEREEAERRREYS